MCRSELPSLRICISISFRSFRGDRSPARSLNLLPHSPNLGGPFPRGDTGRCCSSEPLVPLLSPVVCRHMFLAFCRRLADPLFVTRLEHLTTAWVAFIEQLTKEVAIPVLVEDQFALGWCGVGLCALNFEESGS